VLQSNECNYCRRLWQPGIVGYLYRSFGLQCTLASRLEFDIIGEREQCLDITPIAHRETSVTEQITMPLIVRNRDDHISETWPVVCRATYRNTYIWIMSIPVTRQLRFQILTLTIPWKEQVDLRPILLSEKGNIISDNDQGDILVLQLVGVRPDGELKRAEMGPRGDLTWRR